MNKIDNGYRIRWAKRYRHDFCLMFLLSAGLWAADIGAVSAAPDPTGTPHDGAIATAGFDERDIIVTGTVTNEEGLGLPGATVSVEGSIS